jgi:hypothetical protein
MLTESTSNTLRSQSTKVSFSHKTVQEFFAAIFISSRSDAQKIVPGKCRNIEDILDMSMICECISKMNPSRICEISNDLMSVINEDKETRDFRTKTDGEDRLDIPLRKLQNKYLSYLQEMPESETIQLCLQDFFIIENDASSGQLQRLLKQNKTKVRSLYIKIGCNPVSLREIIDIFSLTDLSCIQKLYLSCDREKEAEINSILFPSLQAVTLNVNCQGAHGEETLSENLVRLQYLQYLHIGGFSLSHKRLETFFNFIFGRQSMKVLTLGPFNCKEHGRLMCNTLNFDLSQHSNLTKLHLQQFPSLRLDITTPSLVYVKLWDINLDKRSVLLSRHMLNIEHVVLWGIEIPARNLQNFITVLENLPQSVTVEMTAIEPETSFECVRENIRGSQTFLVMQNEPWAFVFKLIKPSKE